MKGTVLCLLQIDEIEQNQSLPEIGRDVLYKNKHLAEQALSPSAYFLNFFFLHKKSQKIKNQDLFPFFSSFFTVFHQILP